MDHRVSKFGAFDNSLQVYNQIVVLFFQDLAAPVTHLDQVQRKSTRKKLVSVIGLLFLWPWPFSCGVLRKTESETETIAAMLADRLLRSLSSSSRASIRRVCVLMAREMCLHFVECRNERRRLRRALRAAHRRKTCSHPYISNISIVFVPIGSYRFDWLIVPIVPIGSLFLLFPLFP